MKHKELKINGTNVITETFESFNELKATLERRPLLWKATDTPAREVTDNEDFRRAKTFSEAEDYLLHGINENVDHMVSRVNVLQKTGTTKKTKRYADVVGYTPIVPNAIMGLPCSMLNEKKVDVKDRVITVTYDPSTAWYVDKDEILEYGCKVISKIMDIERRGYRVRLEYMNSNADDKNKPTRQYVLRMLLKHEGQPVNIKRLAFAMTHAAMQRYIGFDWAERLPGSTEMHCYGYSASVSEGSRKNIREMLGDNEYFIYYGADLDEVFSAVK